MSKKHGQFGFRLQASGFRRFMLAACGLWLAACFLDRVEAAGSKVYIKTLPNNHYQLMVNGEPYIVKGVCYNPIPIGQNHQYDWWSDPEKPWLADGKLMQAMGINTVRIYQIGKEPEAVKKVIPTSHSK